MSGALWGAYYSFTSIAYFLAWPVLMMLAISKGSRNKGWRERLGFLPGNLPRGALWLHAASVGEVTALGPVIKEIRRRSPDMVLAISTMTETGRSRARNAYGLRAVLAPLDAPRCVSRWLAGAAPRAILVMETELWPIWLSAAAERAPVAWINGRISDRAFPRYLMIKPLLRRVFSRMQVLCVAGHRDARRAKRLGAPPKAIHIMGNVKADLTARVARPRKAMPRYWFVAGSTRTGEDEIVLAAFRILSRAYPKARLCLAPRHLERIGDIEALVRKAGFTCKLRSRGGGSSGVLILDTHGELTSFYRRAAAAFVGGTLVPVGGHNILEPASLGVPVYFGPYTANVREQANGLIRRKGGFRVHSASALAAHWIKCLRAPEWALATGRRARSFVESQQGAASRLAGLLCKEGLL